MQMAFIKDRSCQPSLTEHSLLKRRCISFSLFLWTCQRPTHLKAHPRESWGNRHAQIPLVVVSLVFSLEENNFKYFISLFLERGEGEREKHQCVVALEHPPTGGLACNPGTCPDWEWNQQLLASQAGTRSTEPPSQGPRGNSDNANQNHEYACTYSLSSPLFI